MRTIPDATTLILEPSSSNGVTDTGDPRDRRVPLWMWAIGVLVVLAASLAGIGLALSDPATPADAAPVAVVSTTTVAEITTTSIPTTTTTLSADPTVMDVRSELEAVLLQTPRSDLNPPEAEDVMKKVDEAIDAADEGDLDKAQKKLSDAAKKVDDKTEGSKREGAMMRLEQLAGLLGVALDGDDRD